MPSDSLTIFFICTHWWGSDARALGQALRGQGHALIEGIYEDYFPQTWMSNQLRLVRKFIRPWIVRQYNADLMRILESSTPDLLLVFKGMLLDPEVVAAAKKRRIPTYCVYPDVTFSNFGSNIVECMKLYDVLFTTKHFHLDLPNSEQLTLPRRRVLVSHGYDPEVHRPIQLSPKQLETYGCDAAYVGVWTPKKESAMQELISRLPNLNLHIWGPGWERAAPEVLKRWKQRGAFGDEATLIYHAAKINLCVLTEAGSGIDQGDEITVRTWQIPASGGFLLHEDTEELKRHFYPGEEVATFSGADQMAKQVTYYLQNPDQRERVRKAGNIRCLKDRQTYEPMARQIIDHFHQSAV